MKSWFESNGTNKLYTHFKIDVDDHWIKNMGGLFYIPITGLFNNLFYLKKIKNIIKCNNIKSFSIHNSIIGYQENKKQKTIVIEIIGVTPVVLYKIGKQLTQEFDVNIMLHNYLTKEFIVLEI